MELSWMSLESEHGFFSTLSSTTSWKSNGLELDALASSTFLFFASISYSVNTSRLNYSQNIINSDRLRLTLSKDDWKSLLTCRFLRSVNSSETSDTTACIVGIEPLMRTLLRFACAIPSRVNASCFRNNPSRNGRSTMRHALKSALWKSTRWRCTNFNHFSLTARSTGNWCIAIPGV